MFKRYILILPEMKMLSLCDQYRARPACTYVLSLKVIIDSSKNEDGLFHLRNSAGLKLKWSRNTENILF